MSEVVAEAIEEVESRVVPTGFYGGKCPFRGGKFIPILDDRCPPGVFSYILQVYDAPKGSDPISHGQPIPVLSQDSYCWGCVYDHVREKEAGMYTEDARRGPTEKKRRKR